METNKLQWKRIAKGDKLPCQSFLRKKNGEILKLSTVGGVKVGQDCYYLPVDEVINVIKGYPVAESEDEKIRKWLICTLKSLNNSPVQIDGAYKMMLPAIAWLEKQGEPKEINPSEFDSQLNRLLKQFKSLPKEELASSLSFYLNVVQNDGTYKEEKQSEQKLAGWSEEDKMQLDAAIHLVSSTGHIETANWLKSLKDRVQPQPQQEWSEEDEEHIMAIDLAVNRCTGKWHCCGEKCPISKHIPWLKSLRHQSTWKPSKEQIVALRWVLNNVPYNKHKEEISGLLDQIKDL